MNNPIAIHESKNSHSVVKFIELMHFTQMFQDMYNNNDVWGVYYNEKGHVCCTDIWGDEETNII